MSGLKTFDNFVNEQTIDFFEDFENRKKNLKLFTQFTKISHNYQKTEIKMGSPKRKFQPKVRVMINNKSNKSIF